jgi:hypothetical protein
MQVEVGRIKSDASMMVVESLVLGEYHEEKSEVVKPAGFASDLQANVRTATPNSGRGMAGQVVTPNHGLENGSLSQDNWKKPPAPPVELSALNGKRNNSEDQPRFPSEGSADTPNLSSDSHQVLKTLSRRQVQFQKRIELMLTEHAEIILDRLEGHRSSISTRIGSGSSTGDRNRSSQLTNGSSISGTVEKAERTSNGEIQDESFADHPLPSQVPEAWSNTPSLPSSLPSAIPVKRKVIFKDGDDSFVVAEAPGCEGDSDEEEYCDLELAIEGLESEKIFDQSLDATLFNLRQGHKRNSISGKDKPALPKVVP